MKVWALLVASFLFLCPLSFGADIRLNLANDAAGLQVTWQPGAQLTAPAELRLEESDDLIHWRLHSRNILPTGQAETWRASIPGLSGKGFYRVVSNFEVELVRSEAADVLGYGDLFKAELKKMGQICTAEFSALYPDRQDYLPGIGWDPTSAQFFAEFNATPQDPRRRDFRLNTVELGMFKKNGFVVSSRINQTNFTDLYYEIFVRDLPVFVSADSVLHAWFKSFESILEYLEELYLAPSLRTVLKGLSDELPNIETVVGNGPLRPSLLDADLYLTTALRLAGDDLAQSKFGRDGQVNILLNAIDQSQLLTVSLFGRPLAPVDFSQFTVRSHYTRSIALSNYFRAMMWCGRFDFRIAGNPWESSPRELGAALIFHEAMTRSGKLALWSDMDATIQRFIGVKDSMDFLQMEQIVKLAGLNSLGDIKTLADLERIKAAIDQGHFGIQEILSDVYVSPFGPAQVWLPRSFAVFGQRFTFDAWALGKTVFDQILWQYKGEPLPRKIVRRRAGALDTAFAVLQNNVAGPEIVARIQNTSGQPFRDGLPYQHNLAAVRAVIDRQEEGAWHESTYGDWLATLRALSEPTTDNRFPESIRTRAWALRRMNTQLASWTQLRHASVLYVKQTYVPNIICFYPAGFVEPNPRFWGALQTMAENTHAHIEQLPLQGSALWQARAPKAPQVMHSSLDLPTVKTGQLQFLERFATNVATLKTLAEKQLRQEAFSTNETTFLLDLVEIQIIYGGPRYTGWYPYLFYGAQEGRDFFTEQVLSSYGDGTRPENVPQFRKSVPLVTDVLSAPPDPMAGDPGAVVHEGVGNVHFMLVAVDNGPDHMVYGGPVFSHYEFDMPGLQRLTDADWQGMIDAGAVPAPPEWTGSWLAPK